MIVIQIIGYYIYEPSKLNINKSKHIKKKKKKKQKKKKKKKKKTLTSASKYLIYKMKLK